MNGTRCSVRNRAVEMARYRYQPRSFSSSTIQVQLFGRIVREFNKHTGCGNEIQIQKAVLWCWKITGIAAKTVLIKNADDMIVQSIRSGEPKLTYLTIA